MKKPKVFLAKLNRGYPAAIQAGFEWTGLDKIVNPSTRIAIKPNLTFPEFRPGVMTNPKAVESLIRYLKNFTPHITLCESDSGGYNRFSMDEVFRKTGLTRIAEKYAVRILNMSNVPSRSIEFRHRYKNLSMPLPEFLLDETDLFVTMPVPKIHMNTRVSFSVKNQWGVIQVPSERLKLHPYFWRVVYEINKHMPRPISVVDGKYGLTRSGPMRGDVVNLNWLMVADNVYAADYVCCVLLGIEPRSIPYLQRIFQAEGLRDADQIEFNEHFLPYVAAKAFYLKRAWTDYPGLMTFNSRFLAYVGYESPLAGLLHRILYVFREPFYDYDSGGPAKS